MGSWTRGIDGVGFALLGIAALWTLVSAVASGGGPIPGIALLGGVGLILVLGRVRGWEWYLPATVLVVALLALLPALRGLPRGRLGSGILGYPNASGALYLQGTVAGLMLAMGRGSQGIRVAAGVGASVLALAALAVSRASGVLLGLVALALIAALLRRYHRILIGVLSVSFLASVAVTTWVAAGYTSGVRSVAVERAVALFDEPRVRLWSEAYALMTRHPIVGVGPGRFSVSSPTARTDRDLRWAHDDFLQQGAETGVPGLLLLALIFVWAFARLASGPPVGASTALAAASVGVLGIHSATDHVLGYALIPLSAATLVSAATSDGSRQFRPGPLLRKTAKAAAFPLGLAGRRRAGDTVILLYHRVGEGGREIDLPVSSFAAQLEELAERDRVVSLDSALDGEGGVVVSFDDGYGDFHEHVLPLLVRYRTPAILYLATGSVVDGGRRALTWSQLREAIATGLVTIGSHTHRHMNLGSVSGPVAEVEMRRSKELIEDELAVPCNHFAYPFGVGSEAAEVEARRLFDSAALKWETNRRGRYDRYRLGRTPVLRSDGPLFFRAKVHGLLDKEAWVYRALGRGPWRRL